MKINKIIGLFAMLCMSLIAFAQQPYKINPVNGLPLLDGSNNPIRCDLNYKLLPSFSNEFAGINQTKTDFNYGTNSNLKELSYIVLEHETEDNCSTGCPCDNDDFFGNILPYGNQSNGDGIGHEYSTNSGVNTVKLITKEFSSNFIRGWYKDATYCRVDKNFSYTTGLLSSNKAFKYGYFESRFKVNRPPGVASTGIGQCFWLFPISNPENIPNFVGQYCYSEIDIAENQPNHGIHGFGAHVSQNDNGDCGSEPPRFITSECECNFYPENVGCANGHSALFHKRDIEQEEFHTYALEWTPTSLRFFYDNVFITTINTIGPNGKTPENFDPMAIIFDIEGGKGKLNYHGRCTDIDYNTVFPFEFEIDYVRQYKLDLSECNLVLPILNNQTTFNSFAANPKVRKEIYVGDGNCNGCMVLVGNGINVSLRASDLIELNDGFEVDVNGEFFADVIGGCDDGY
ncbi:MAG: glycoside hydrolase family 16 protein [Bacteroidia bacterium]|nr:glycoside hydrolase family 16 protein [Bacteroidia bacterium]